MIPGEDKKFKGQFSGNYAGNLWQTFNIDLEKDPGRVCLSGKLQRQYSGLGVVDKFIRSNANATDQWYGLVVDSTPSGTSGNILSNGNATITAGTWASDGEANSPNDPHDAVIHESANGEQRLLATVSTDIAILNKSGAANDWDVDWGSTVATGGQALSSSVYHPIARLQRLVAVGDKVSTATTNIPVIHTIDSSDVFTVSRLQFGAEYTVRNIYASSNRFWIGLQHNAGGKAKIVEWDGSSSSQNNEYELVGSNPLSGFIVDDIPYFIDERGYIYRYTGGGFKKIQDFGFYKEHQPVVLESTDLKNYGCHYEDGIVYINIALPTVKSPGATSMYRGIRRSRAGIWIFNTKNLNLYHHLGFGEFASSGTDINYGTSPLGAVGAVIKPTDSALIYASASVYVGGATWQASQTNGLFFGVQNDSMASNQGRNRGYIITPYIPIEDVEAFWQGVVLKFKKFANSNNQIVVKWRVTEPLFNASAVDQGGNAFESGGINAPITWINTTSFSCKVPTGVSVGDEVEILAGDNAGCCFNIATLSGTPDNSTLLTVTITETAPTSSTDTSLVRFDNWKTETAIGTDTNQPGSRNVAFQTKGHGEFVQLKIELRGLDVRLDEIIPIFNIKTSIKQS